MKLRLAATGGDAQHPRQLLVLVPLNVVQDENAARAGWKTRDRTLEIDPLSAEKHPVRPRSRIPCLRFIVTFASLLRAPPEVQRF